MRSPSSELLHRGTCRLTAPFTPLIESLTFSTPPTTPPPSSPSPQPFIWLCATASYGTAQPAELCCILTAFCVVQHAQWCCGVTCPTPLFKKEKKENTVDFFLNVLIQLSCVCHWLVICLSLSFIVTKSVFFVTNKLCVCYYNCVFLFYYVFILFCLPRLCYMYYNDYYMKLVFDQ